TWGMQWLKVVDVPAGARSLTVDMGPPANAGALTGTINTASGEALRDSRLSLGLSAVPQGEVEGAFYMPHGTSMEPGNTSYRVTDLPAGRYGLLVRSYSRSIPNMWIPDIEVKAGMAGTVPIQLSAGRPVRLMFVDRDEHIVMTRWR